MPLLRRFHLVALLCAIALPLLMPSHAAAAKARKNAAKSAPKQDLRPTVAVLYFDYSGKDEELAMLRKGLAQMMISDLSAVEEARLVERDRLQELIAELKLQKTNRFDKKTAAKLGKLLGARYLVLGGYFVMMGSLRVDARVVEVQTGKVVKSVGASGKKDDFIAVQQKIAAGLTRVLRTQLPKLKVRVTKRTRTTKSRPKAPKKLSTTTALQYAKALDAKDRGDLKLAAATMKQVVKAQPDFQLAQLDLAAMAQ